MKRAKLLRGLRIAISAVGGILCVVLIVLWVRSHSWIDLVYVKYHPRLTMRFASARGELRWEVEMHPAPQPWQLDEPHNPGWEFSISRPRAASDPDLKLKNVFGFRRLSPKYGPIPVIPQWFALVMVGGLGIVLARGYSFQFSLRTLLIATTLIAVVLGLVVWAGS